MPRRNDKEPTSPLRSLLRSISSSFSSAVAATATVAIAVAAVKVRLFLLVVVTVHPKILQRQRLDQVKTSLTQNAGESSFACAARLPWLTVHYGSSQQRQVLRHRSTTLNAL